MAEVKKATLIADHQIARSDRRLFPRFRFVKNTEVSIGRSTYSSCCYDISQGGLSFIAENIIANQRAFVRLQDIDQVLSGRILERREAEKPGLYRYHMQFDMLLDRTDLDKLLKTVE